MVLSTYMKILATFKIPITLKLNYEQEQEARRLINQLHVQDDDCNHHDPVTKKYGAKYPEYEKAHPEFMEAHYAISRSVGAHAAVNLMEDGSIQLV
jgi:hypothetical protein